MHRRLIILRWRAAQPAVSRSELALSHAVQVLASLARRRNQRPLPEVARKHGLRLPPDAECLTQPGYAPIAPLAGAQLHSSVASIGRGKDYRQRNNSWKGGRALPFGSAADQLVYPCAGWVRITWLSNTCTWQSATLHVDLQRLNGELFVR